MIEVPFSAHFSDENKVTHLGQYWNPHMVRTSSMRLGAPFIAFS